MIVYLLDMDSLLIIGSLSIESLALNDSNRTVTIVTSVTTKAIAIQLHLAF